MRFLVACHSERQLRHASNETKEKKGRHKKITRTSKQEEEEEEEEKEEPIAAIHDYKHDALLYLSVSSSSSSSSYAYHRECLEPFLHFISYLMMPHPHPQLLMAHQYSKFPTKTKNALFAQ